MIALFVILLAIAVIFLTVVLIRLSKKDKPDAVAPPANPKPTRTNRK